ncbi:MAG: protein kinase [Parachlamydiaceae bacterium]|nr:protein kinase [Parachlamydiaceae bacterium]
MDDQQNTEPLPQSKESYTPESLEIPHVIGQFKIESLLPGGGMSRLYLATDLKTQSEVAVKILLPKYVYYPDIVERFLREAEILSYVDHPNIVKMYSHGTWEGGFYIVMEFILGGSLRQCILNNPLSLRRALEMILDIAYGVCHLHTQGIIHRDLKLENILVTDEGVIKIIDFGIAQLLHAVKDEEQSAISQRTVGTPIYMSPEQRENPETVSYPSDIYSLGIIAYELLLGRLSHGHVHLALMPKGLQKILAKSLQPDPRDRYQDIVDFIGDLSNYMNSDALENERRGGDRTTEFFESLLKAKKMLYPLVAPVWTNLEVGIAANAINIPIGSYFDFLQLDPSIFAIALGQSEGYDAEGVLFSAAVRSLVRAFLTKDISLTEFASLLNEKLLQDIHSMPFGFCCLKLCPLEKTFYFLSCGYGALWHISHGTEMPHRIICTGSVLKAKDATYEVEVTPFLPGDQLLVYGGGNCTAEMEKVLIQEALEQKGSSPRQKAEAIMRKLKATAPQTSSVIVIEHKEV